MSERNKTLVALAVLAAALGVYLEISYRAKLKASGKSDPAVVPAPSSH